MTPRGTGRVAGEIIQIQKGSDLSLAVDVEEHDIRKVKALIIGPPDTPYEYGFFEFLVRFGNDYPDKPPKVDARTTNRGRCRFNPNIYAGGRVCLSILGTWTTERPGEEWSSAQGLESVLISIQSLMSSNPYENEPGFDNAKAPHDKKNMADYVDKIRHETLRIAVVQVMENILGLGRDGALTPPDSVNWGDEVDAEVQEELSKLADNDSDASNTFKDLIKRRFLWYYDTYLTTASKYSKIHKKGQKFAQMPFEHPENTMEGSYNYEDLLERLRSIKLALDGETARWAQEGLVAKMKERGNAANLQRQFEQLVEYNKVKGIFTLEIELADGNPFVWDLTYFGKPGTPLDGGVYMIRLSLSTNFPSETIESKDVDTDLPPSCV